MGSREREQLMGRRERERFIDQLHCHSLKTFQRWALDRPSHIGKWFYKYLKWSWMLSWDPCESSMTLRLEGCQMYFILVAESSCFCNLRFCHGGYSNCNLGSFWSSALWGLLYNFCQDHSKASYLTSAHFVTWWVQLESSLWTFPILLELPIVILGL